MKGYVNMSDMLIVRRALAELKALQRIVMSHTEELAGLKSDMSNLINAIDKHLAEVNAVLSVAITDDTVDIVALRSLVASSLAKLAITVAPIA